MKKIYDKRYYILFPITLFVLSIIPTFISFNFENILLKYIFITSFLFLFNIPLFISIILFSIFYDKRIYFAKTGIVLKKSFRPKKIYFWTEIKKIDFYYKTEVVGRFEFLESTFRPNRVSPFNAIDFAPLYIDQPTYYILFSLNETQNETFDDLMHGRYIFVKYDKKNTYLFYELCKNINIVNSFKDMEQNIKKFEKNFNPFFFKISSNSNKYN